MTSIKKTVFFLIAAAFFLLPCFGKRITFEGHPFLCIDMPEGFKLEDSHGDSLFQLQNVYFPVYAIVQIKDNETDAKKILEETMQKLSFTGETSTFIWRDQTAALSLMEGTIAGTESTGYGIACPMADSKGIIQILTWCAKSSQNECAQIMASLTDSLYIDLQSFYCPGPLTTLAYPETNKKIRIKMNIDGKEIQSLIDSTDKEAQDFVIKREYDILLNYGNASEWKEAWKRYYRMIFRDSAGRLMNTSDAIGEVLAPECQDETELAQKLLSWTQNFNYKRKHESTDFESPCGILLGNGSDCDARAMLISVIMQNLGFDSIIFVSSEFSHSLAGLNSQHPGFAFEVDGKKYLTGETTVKNLTWGKINQNQTDFSKWIPVTLP